MQTPCFDAIFTDLDGTLLNSSQRVGAQDADTIKKLQTAGVPVYFATGRHPAFCSRYAQQLQMPMAVACNGALVWDVDAQQPLQVFAFTPEQLRRLYGFCAQRGLIYSVQTDKMPYFSKQDPRVDLARHTFRMSTKDEPFTGFGLREELKDPAALTVAKLALQGLHEADFVGLQSQFADCALSLYPQISAAEIGPGGTSKWHGILWLAQKKGISPGRVLVLGDSANDVPMLRQARYTAVPRSGAKEALQYASYVCAGHDDDPLTSAIRHFCPALLGQG